MVTPEEGVLFNYLVVGIHTCTFVLLCRLRVLCVVEPLYKGHLGTISINFVLNMEVSMHFHFSDKSHYLWQELNNYYVLNIQSVLYRRFTIIIIVNLR